LLKLQAFEDVDEFRELPWDPIPDAVRQICDFSVN